MLVQFNGNAQMESESEKTAKVSLSTSIHLIYFNIEGLYSIAPCGCRPHRKRKREAKCQRVKVKLLAEKAEPSQNSKFKLDAYVIRVSLWLQFQIPISRSKGGHKFWAELLITRRERAEG